MNEELSILHVEDDELDAEALRRSMKKRGLEAELTWVTDGAKALDYLRQADASQLRALVVLLDLNMPRVSGHEFLEKLRNELRLSKAVVFVVTSSEHRRDIALAYEQNVAGYFHKDKVEELVEILKRYQSGAHLPQLGA
ncbi:MAG: response regulator [Aureliella sp.]